jgi:PST family polysaccharide transporter
MSLSDKTIHGVAWTIAAEAIVKCISPISFLVLSRILAPADFGVVAIATTVLSFVNIIVDLGTGKVLVQLQCNDEELKKYCDSSFWFNVCIGVFLYAIIFIFSGAIARYNNQPLATPVIKVMAIQVVFFSLSTVQSALMNRAMNYKSLFFIRLVTVAVPAILSIPIAFLGGGLWAIVIGNVGGTFFSMIAMWYYSSWKPRLRFGWDYLKRIFSKSIWSSFQQIAIWLPTAFDTYLLSNLLSSHALGLYTSSRMLFGAVAAMLMAPILPVFFSALSRVEDDAKFKTMTFMAQRTLFSFSAFVSLFVLIYSDIICGILFNSQWDGIAELVRVFFVVQGFELFYSIIIEALRSRGFFRELALNNMICTLISLVILYYSAKNGLWTYTVARCACLLLCYFGVFYFSRKYLGISFMDCVRNSKLTLIASGIMFVAYFALRHASAYLYYPILTVILLVSVAVYFYYERDAISLVMSKFSFRRKKEAV